MYTLYEYIVAPLKILDAPKFYNFRHPVSKSWLRPWGVGRKIGNMGKLEKTYGLIRAETNKGGNIWSETDHVMNITFLKRW